MFYVYLLRSEVDASFYIGFTENPAQRLIEHNNGRSMYTKRKIPWRMCYIEKYETKTAALKREKFLKKQRNKDFYQRLVKKLDR